MIPFRDNIPSRTFPVVNTVLIVINCLVFFQELAMGHRLEHFLYIFGVIPLRLVQSLTSFDSTFVIALPTFFTAMFLHGGWLHLIGNMWYLWIFGDNVEDFLGHFHYLLFYFACGFGGNLVHVVFNPTSAVPTVGASGAIAGVLGAYILLYPGARVLTLIPLFIIWPILEIPAVIFLGFWFVQQFFSGFFSFASASPQAGGVAWFAHIGGFMAGMIWVARTRVARRRRWGSS